jgi:hypothetical protein
VTLGEAGVDACVADGLTLGVLAGANSEEPDRNVEAVSGMQASSRTTFRTSSTSWRIGRGEAGGIDRGAEPELNGTV